MKNLILATLLAAGLVACGSNYSNGTRVGVVTKLSKKGLMFDSWEGEMLMALPSDSGMIQPEKFQFSVQDETVVKELQKAMASGKRVELYYRQWFQHPPSIDTDYVIRDVNPTK